MWVDLPAIYVSGDVRGNGCFRLMMSLHVLEFVRQIPAKLIQSSINANIKSFSVRQLQAACVLIRINRIPGNETCNTSPAPQV